MIENKRLTKKILHFVQNDRLFRMTDRSEWQIVQNDSVLSF